MNNNDNIRFPSSAQRLEYEEEPDENGENFLKKRIAQIVIDIVCIIITFVVFILVYLYVDPKIVTLFCNDTDIFQPYKEDTIVFWVVGLYATLGPIIFIIFIELINSKIVFCKKSSSVGIKKRKLFGIAFLHALTLFILGIAITLLITEVGKRWVGRLRPHFISVCQPNLSTLNCTTTSGSNTIYNAIDTTNICTGSASAVKEVSY